VRKMPTRSAILVPVDPLLNEPAHPPPRAPLPPTPPLRTALAPERYKIQFTASAAFCRKLDRAKDLMRSSVPSGDVAVILEAALTEMLGKLEARRFALTSKPRADAPEGTSAGRYRPAAVRRAVFHRDGGRCRFLNAEGSRCPARAQLEFHHVEPYARGGAATVANIQLMCRAHNAHLAERDFGAAHMAPFRRDSASRPPPAAPSRA